MAQRRFRVFILESETKFKDRVRGEQMASWGVADARNTRGRCRPTEKRMLVRSSLVRDLGGPDLPPDQTVEKRFLGEI
jgi:hypothetical protein